MPDVEESPRSQPLDGGRYQLAEVVNELEQCLRKVDELGLTLLGALIDHALAEAKRELSL